MLEAQVKADGSDALLPSSVGVLENMNGACSAGH